MKIREGMFQSYEFSCIALEHAFSGFQSDSQF
jgi:hypothetical protein